MSVPILIATNHEVAKSNIINNLFMSEDYKKQLLEGLAIAELATNGISTDEKILKIAESIHNSFCSLAAMYNDIMKAVKEQNSKQCENCHAMKFVKEEEEEKLRQLLILLMLNANGNSKQEDEKDMSWKDVIKTILVKPYIYMVACVLAISPYGLSILNAIFAYFSSK